MSNESSTLFKPLMANQHLTVLLLIENSKEMYSVWEELKDCYLSPLIDAISRANNPAATSLFVVESSVDSIHALRPYPPNNFALSGVKFNFNLDGRISPSRVNECIQHLDGTVCGGDTLSAVHFVIVAASTPSDNCTGLALPDTGIYTPWTLLAEKLSERRIHCHLAMVPGYEDITPLTVLFEQTLRLQNHVEEFPPFPVDQFRFIFRLSARPLHHALGDLEHAMPTYPAVQGANAIGTASRRNSYLLDPQSDVNLVLPSVTSFTPQTEISLVSHLKLAQGLIKKKQHSKDPQPAPFFGDARVQDTTCQSYPVVPSSSPPTVASPSSASSSSSVSTMASSSSSSSGSSSSLSSVPLTSRHRKPQPLAMGLGTNPEAIPTNGGRAMSITKAERLQRINHATSGSSPTESLYMHGRRASQVQVPAAAAIGSIMGAAGQGVPNGTWLPSNSHGPQVHAQRGSPLSATEQDPAIGSPTSSASSLGSGSGSASGTVVGAPSGANVLSVGLNMGGGSVAEVGSSVTETFASTSPSITMATLVAPNGMGNQDMSPGSGSSYVSSDMSSPTTPGSIEEVYMHARMQALQHHGHGVTYQHGANQQSMAVTSAQDNTWMSQRQQQQQSLRLHQLQEMQMLQNQQEHDQKLQQLQQASAIPQQARYPSPYDPATSGYFPTQHATQPQQYYLPQQAQPRVAEPYHPTAIQISDSFQDPQTHHSMMQQYRQATRHSQAVPQSYNPYPVPGTPVSASPPPMIVPSQSHVPLTAVHPPTGLAPTNPAPIQGRMVANRSPPRSVPSHGPAHGRARASTMAGGTLSNLRGAASVPSLSKSARWKKHKKSASSTSHSASTDSKATSSTTAAPQGDEVFEVSPLYAASTGVLFESMFNIKSGLLDGPAALANPEDVAIVAPALGLGREAETTLSLGTVEAAGGLFRSSIRDRGAVVDEAAGTAVVPVSVGLIGPPGSLHGDTSTTSTIPAATTMVGQSLTAAKGDMALMSTVSAAMPGSTFLIPPTGVGSLLPPSSTYRYPLQEVSQEYGTSPTWPN